MIYQLASLALKFQFGLDSFISRCFGPEASAVMRQRISVSVEDESCFWHLAASPQIHFAKLGDQILRSTPESFEILLWWVGNDAVQELSLSTLSRYHHW